MKRRTFLIGAGVTALAPLAVFYSSRQAQALTSATVQRLKKPHTAWRNMISLEAYKILFEEHTEPPGSSSLNDEYREGTYICAACYLPLFESQYKYDSGTGWPSFTQPIAGHIDTKKDYKLIIPRTEYHCARCGGHQGHVFKDGPKPRGERWCNNGLALKFIVHTESLPPLRG
ncbi:peptide-methionine (R)-S-oxide reductase MsrB [Nitrosomonas marina]|uniref:peptide-methionine (R)-S-oxide reductase n=1 Tax=Nitrosomonas marina TaxID=917 RepID=A0A1H8I9Q9_9PROT|nr:peptide-methionine (R)-S-oxide reductase MsrB [Nitrosomonas marina]SEN64865.1 peptide-methionine (R)-S-oxide reductase [Nitrosomonas marina]